MDFLRCKLVRLLCRVFQRIREWFSVDKKSQPGGWPSSNKSMTSDQTFLLQKLWFVGFFGRDDVEPYWNLHRGMTQILDYIIWSFFFGMPACHWCLSPRTFGRSSSQWFFFGKKLPDWFCERAWCQRKKLQHTIPNGGEKGWFTMGKNIYKKHLHEFQGILFFDDVSECKNQGPTYDMLCVKPFPNPAEVDYKKGSEW